MKSETGSSYIWPQIPQGISGDPGDRGSIIILHGGPGVTLQSYPGWLAILDALIPGSSGICSPNAHPSLQRMEYRCFSKWKGHQFVRSSNSSSNVCFTVWTAQNLTLPWLQLVMLVMVAASVRDSSAWMMLDFVREVLPVKFENVTHQNETRKPNTKGMKNTAFWWLCPKDVHLTVASTTLTVQLARPRWFMSSRSKKLSWWPLRWWWMFLSRERGDIGSVKTDRRRLWKLSGSHSYHDNVAKSMLKLLRHVGFSNLGSLRHILLRGFGTVCPGCCKPACLLSETQKAG